MAADFPMETPAMAAIRAQRAYELLAQEKASGQPIEDAELDRAAALPRAEGTNVSDAVAAQPKLVRFQGQTHQFPATFTDQQISEALASLAPQPSQADVRAAEPKATPMESQKEKEARFADAMQRYVKQTGGTIPPGKNIRQAAEEWSGIQDPVKTREGAELDELRAGGELQYGDSVPYAAAKAVAATAGFAAAGPAGATGMETLVRQATLAFNLTKAVKAGAIDEDRAVEIFAKESLKGAAGDAAVNFGLPILGQIAKRVPGAQWLYDKIAARVGQMIPGGMTTAAQDAAEQRARALARLAERAPSPAAKKAVEELGNRAPDVIPTPGQVTGEASVAEQTARVVDPNKFDKAQQQLASAAEGMRQEALDINPTGPSLRQGIGQSVLDTMKKTERALKDRLRPTFTAADKLGVSVDLTAVAQRAKAALAEDAASPAGKLEPREIAELQKIIARIEATGKAATEAMPVTSALVDAAGKPIVKGEIAAQAAVPPVTSPAGTLDSISRLKETMRELPDYKPSKYYETVVGDLTNGMDDAYQAAAKTAPEGSAIAKALERARADYREFMGTAYDGATETALKRTPEDVGRVFWQGGNMTEIGQFQKLLNIAQREAALGNGEARDNMRRMTLGFLQEAVPNLQAAASWSKTLAESPLKRDTWNALTATPGGSQLRGAMEVLEQAAKIAQREHKDVVGSLGLAAIPISRAAGGGLGVSLVTGAFHPVMAGVGISVDVTARMAATAYTQGNKGVLNAIMRVLRANSAGTAAGAKALQATLPELQKFAQDNDLGDLIVPAADAAASAVSGTANAAEGPGYAVYRVIDTQTGKTVGQFKIRGQARAFADKKDNEYGAYRFTVSPTTSAGEQKP